MVIDKKSALYRWYDYGVGYYKPHQENLCHFIRVILLWSTIRWFFLARTHKVIFPWSVALATGLVALGILFPLPTLIALGGLVGSVAFIALIAEIAINYGNVLENYIAKPLKEFFGYEIVRGVYSIYIFIAIAIGLGFWFFTKITLIILAVLVGMVAALSIIVGTAFGMVAIIDKIEEMKIGYDSRTEAEKNSGVIGFFRILTTYLKAYKKKVCPLVEFAE